VSGLDAETSYPAGYIQVRAYNTTGAGAWYDVPAFQTTAVSAWNPIDPGFTQMMPLQIISPKAAGTGNPAIPSTHRVFRAYPGIPYQIRAAVVGGVYPYFYELSNAPSGMTIEPYTGRINWSNPQSSTGTITLTVTDALLNQVQSSWVINVSTTNFHFIDGSYSGTETGSITQPYSSIANMLASVSGAATRSHLVYLRAGTYNLPAGSGELSIDNNPHGWMGYPGEPVTINGNNRYLRIPGAEQHLFLHNIRFYDWMRYCLMVSGGRHYQAVYACEFERLRNDTDSNINQGFFYTTSSTTQGLGWAFQDNTWHDFVGGQAIGSLYSMSYALIEGNHMYDGGYPYSASHTYSTPIGVKNYIRYSTVRGNTIDLPSTATQFGMYLAPPGESWTFEFCYNLVRRTGGANAIFWFKNPTNIRIRRNTYSGVVEYGSTITLGEDFEMRRDVVSGSITNGHVVTQVENLVGSDLLNADGTLKTAYDQYRGTHGHEIVY
jgi:hypothetical protein